MPFSELPYEATFGYALWQPSSSSANVINAGFAYNLKQKFAIGFGFNMGLNKPYDIIDASGAANGTFTPMAGLVGVPGGLILVGNFPCSAAHIAVGIAGVGVRVCSSAGVFP